MADGGRKLTVFASFYSLIQGLIWCLIAVYCVCIYKCLYEIPFYRDPKDKTFFSLFYASYFNGSCTGGLQFQNLENPAPSSIRTFYWMIGYIVLSASWIPVSLLLMLGSVGKKFGSYGSCTYVPWIIVTCANIIADAVAIGFYSADIFYTLSTNDYIKFIGATGDWQSITGTNSLGQDTAAPAVAMVLFFSRAVVLWFFNLGLLYHVIQELRQLHQLEIQDSEYEGEEKFRTWNRPFISPHPLENRNRSSKKDNEIKPKNRKGTVVLKREVSSLSQLSRSPESDHRASDNESVVMAKADTPVYPIHHGLHEGSPRTAYKLDEFGIPIEEVRLPRMRVDRRSEIETPIIKPVSESHLLKRPSFRGVQRPVQSEELRGQVPWSYLTPASSPHSQVPVRRPVIPDPDYGPPAPRQQYPYVLSRPNSSTTRTNIRQM